MATSRLSNTGDWTFGQQLAGHIRGSEEIAQNVVTRIKSFKNDWYLDSDAEIDWFNLLSNRNTEQTTKNQIETTVLNTTGVSSLKELNFVLDRENRKASISLKYIDIYNESQTVEAEV